MIFRVHKPVIDGYGNLGTFVGYINLCHGYISGAAILAELIRGKLLQPNRVRADEIVASPGNAVGGLLSYMIHKKLPRAAAVAAAVPHDPLDLLLAPRNPNPAPRPPRFEPLFYLHPLESIKEKVAPAETRPYVLVNTNPITFTVNTYNYVWTDGYIGRR